MTKEENTNTKSTPPSITTSILNQKYSLPIIIHFKSGSETYSDDAIVAAMLGVIGLLSTAEASGEHKNVISAWENHEMRKVVRRAWAARWDEIQELPGVTVEYETATVRVLYPHLLSETPRAVSKLQVEGLELLNKESKSESKRDLELSVSINPEFEMSTGKRMAQAGHIAHLFHKKYMHTSALKRWEGAGSVIHVIPWSKSDEYTLNVHDAGHTEVPENTETARGYFSAL